MGKPGLSLIAVPEVDLAVRLHEFGPLPEGVRKAFIETVSTYAVEGQDLYALDDPGVRVVFQDSGFDELVETVRQPAGSCTHQTANLSAGSALAATTRPVASAAWTWDHALGQIDPSSGNLVHGLALSHGCRSTIHTINLGTSTPLNRRWEVLSCSSDKPYQRAVSLIKELDSGHVHARGLTAPPAAP